MDFDKWKMPDIDVVKYYANAFDINYFKTENELRCELPKLLCN